MKLAVCDALPQQRQELVAHLTRYGGAHDIDIQIMEWESDSALISSIHSPTAYDLIFLDIHREDMTWAYALRQGGYRGALVLCSDSSDYAIKGYEVEADAYLVKPYSNQELGQTMNRMVRKYSLCPNAITLMVNHVKRRLAAEEIVYAETADHSIVIHLTNGKLRLRLPLSELENILAPQEAFLRCHRSYLVNMDYISGVDPNFFYMENGEKILISVRNSARLRKQVSTYRWKQVKE